MTDKKDIQFEVLRNSEGIKAPDSSVFVTIEDWEYYATEIAKCKNDIIYFAEKYYTIIGPTGKQLIQLYPKQKELLQAFADNQRTIVLAARQTGKTTCYNIFALWMCLYNEDVQVLICANKESMAIEFLDRIKLAFILLPNFLKIGCKKWSGKKIIFENDSSVEASSTTPDSARGKSCSILLLDECLTKNNNITIRNKNTGEIETIPINKLFEDKYV